MDMWRRRGMVSAFLSILLPYFFLEAESRIASDSFVNRWAFQRLCNFTFDPRKVWATKETGPVTFNPTEVKEGDLIFVRNAPLFFKTMHHAIEVPYFIMTHGEYLDKFVPAYFNYLNDPKILGWFTIHPCSEPHERVFALPLGVVQYKDICLDYGRYNKIFERKRRKTKKKLLYMNFTDWANPQRKLIRQFFLQKSFCTAGSLTHFAPYIKELSKYKFVISPPGLGPDCYRVWESLLLGTIPIVQHSDLDGLYAGLPVLFITAWEEVTEAFLEKSYKEMKAKSYSSEKLFMNYWEKYIEHKKKLCWELYETRRL